MNKLQLTVHIAIPKPFCAEYHSNENYVFITVELTYKQPRISKINLELLHLFSLFFFVALLLRNFYNPSVQRGFTHLLGLIV